MRARLCALRAPSRRVRHDCWIACLLLLLLGPLVASAQGLPEPSGIDPQPAAGVELVEAELPPPSTTVAVVPFRVHSPRPVDYLGRSLADLLRSRLEASGRLLVLDAATSQQAAESGAHPREMAKQLEADYVVTGSLTELAGRFSLDVRITPALPSLPSHTQVWTASAEEELLGRVSQVSRTVSEHILGAAPAIVARVAIRGAAGFERELLSRLLTQPGAPYSPVDLRQDLATLRSNPAVVSAEAETERGDDGISVRFQIVLADPSLAVPSLGAGDRIAEIRIRGNRRIEEAAIRSRIASRSGDRYDPVQIGRDIGEVHALGFFRNVQVFAESTPEGQVLIFDVDENPVVRQISITGNDNVESDRIRDILTLTTGSTLDNPLLFENRERIEQLYKAEGYYLAEVDFEVEPISEASVGVNFDVDEKEKLRLKTIEFVGNEHFSSRELAEDFQTKRWRFWSYATSWFDRSGTYSEPLFLQDLRTVERKYTDAGFLQAKLGEPEVIPSEEGLTVVVDIVEGRRFRVGDLEVTGDSTVDIESLRDKLELVEGEYFNRSALTQDVAQLTEHYQDRGFYFAQVTPLSDLTQASESVNVRFDVRKGPLYFVREVGISGNTVTVDPVIRREVPIVEGQLYSQRAVMLARRKIEGLGFFEEVDFKVEPTEEGDQLDLRVNVVERPTGSFSFGAGFSSQDGLVVTGSLSQSNLFGRGYAANISVDFGGRTQRFFINLQDPYFLGSSFSLGTTISRTNVRFNDFDQEQLGADVVLGHTLSEDNRSRGFLRYSFNLRRLGDDTDVLAAAPILREVLQDTLSSSLLGISMIQDTRNDRFAPTAGRRLGLSLEGAGFGGFTKFARIEAQASYFFGAPRWLLDRSTFVAKTRMGWAFPFNLIQDYESPPFFEEPAENKLPLDQIDRDLRLPLTERYFLGGIGQFGLRGFESRSVGPRRTILKPVQLGLFTPLGYELNETTGEVFCRDELGRGNLGNGNGKCNDLNQTDDFDDLDETDVIGGNKFITSSLEYRFPISETIGLQGVLFVDMGNAFSEEDYNLFDVTEWRYGTGAGVQWFSPFGPLAVILGFPLDKLSVEKSPVFEFSVGGAGF